MWTLTKILIHKNIPQNLNLSTYFCIFTEINNQKRGYCSQLTPFCRLPLLAKWVNAFHCGFLQPIASVHQAEYLWRVIYATQKTGKEPEKSIIWAQATYRHNQKALFRVLTNPSPHLPIFIVIIFLFLWARCLAAILSFLFAFRIGLTTAISFSSCFLLSLFAFSFFLIWL